MKYDEEKIEDLLDYLSNAPAYNHEFIKGLLRRVGHIRSDPRPENCRERLKEGGKPYPQSRCFACGICLKTRPVDCPHQSKSQ